MKINLYRDAQIRSSNIWRKYIPIFEIFSNLLTVVLMIVGGYMVIQGEMSIGQFVTVNGYLWMLNNPVRQFGWIINDIQNFVTSIEKIYSTYKIKKIRESENWKYLLQSERVSGKIKFENVYYYSYDDVILKDINFEVEPGQTVGIIGATGSGKSTLMNLLCRYDVSDGRITIGRVNVKNFDLHSLRGSIGIAMQDVLLFSDTIEGNIAYGNPECSFEEVEKAAKIANADGFIRKMPEGYDTIVGEEESVYPAVKDRESVWPGTCEESIHIDFG